MPSPQQEAAERWKAQHPEHPDPAVADFQRRTESPEAAAMAAAVPEAAVIAAQADAAQVEVVTPEVETVPETDDEPKRHPLSGKYVVLVLDTEGDHEYGGGWRVLADAPGEGGAVVPQLHEGNSRDAARGAALEDERNAALAEMVRADYKRFLLAAVPASSWQPTPMKPKVTKTTWTPA